jgi:hypothetical protein
LHFVLVPDCIDAAVELGALQFLKCDCSVTGKASKEIERWDWNHMGNENIGTDFDTSQYKYIMLFWRWQPSWIFSSEAVYFEALAIDKTKTCFGVEVGGVHDRYGTAKFFSQCH